ncbi:MAG: pepsin/retropepsin-like aspartic protease family protein [Leadbetterella sp.]
MLKKKFEEYKSQISSQDVLFIQAHLDNAFNKLESSNQSIKKLLKAPISDSVRAELYALKKDNAIKLYNYKDARSAIDSLLGRLRYVLTEDKTKDLENDFKIWSTLENIPKQRIKIQGETHLNMIRDKVGLNTLKISKGKDTLDFIFDTGANLSCVTESSAKLMQMKVFDPEIEVGSITGKKVKTKIGVCEYLKIGNIEVWNAIFLVFRDSDLAFPQISYQMNGILGFPVIEAMKEIQISKDGSLVIPKIQTQINQPSNMAIMELIPLICIDEKHFTFDTGADHTILYRPYYLTNKNYIDTTFKRTKIKFGGAGGAKDFEGFKVDHTFTILDKKASLQDVSLVSETIDDDKYVYGNIGQDVIKQFSKMTINFSSMFIKFD